LGATAFAQASATIAITNTVGTVAPGTQMTVVCSVKNTGTTAQTFGVGAEILQNSNSVAQIGQATTSSIGPNTSATVTINYTIPTNFTVGNYTAHCVVWSGTPGSSTWLNDTTQNFAVQTVINATISILNNIGTVTPGTTIPLQFSVTNTGNVSNAFGVGAQIQQGSTVLTQAGQATTPSLAPNTSGTVTLNFNVPLTWTAGIYTAYSVVWSGTPGSSTWLNNTTQNFTLSASLTGRLCYQVYSAYLAQPPVNSSDGNLMIYNLPSSMPVNVTGTLALTNALNPHFSPDGSKVVFCAIPQGGGGGDTPYHSLEIYLYDLADLTLCRLTNNAVADEDPNFSPDGHTVIFKENGQICTMNLDGGNIQQLTDPSIESSDPSYSPDGSMIVYYIGAKSGADIWWMQANGAQAAKLIATPSLEEYFPVYRDSENILYTRWETANAEDDKIYNYSINSGVSQPLMTNLSGYDDSDAFPINATLIGFSSDRPGGVGTYDIYLGNPSSGAVYTLPNANSTLQELGGTYSQFSHARKVTVVAPAQGTPLAAGATVTFQVYAWSDGGPWTGASPTVTLQGPDNTQSVQFQDIGVGSGPTANYEIYSFAVTLPSTPGSYAISVSANSVDNGLTNVIASGALAVTVTPAVPAAPKWMLILLAPLFWLVALRTLHTKRA
jgi:Tol biopolymer transport system component